MGHPVEQMAQLGSAAVAISSAVHPEQRMQEQQQILVALKDAGCSAWLCECLVG